MRIVAALARAAAHIFYRVDTVGRVPPDGDLRLGSASSGVRSRMLIDRVGKARLEMRSAPGAVRIHHVAVRYALSTQSKGRSEGHVEELH